MQQPEQIANVIDLTLVRQARQAGSLEQAKPASRGRVVAAAGFVTVAVALAFGAYITYQAAQFGALGDPFVLAAFAVTGTYLGAGALMVKLSGRWNGALEVAEVAAEAEAPAAPSTAEETESPSPVILAFPERQTANSGSFSLICSECGGTYGATALNVNCPDCGRVARAG